MLLPKRRLLLGVLALAAALTGVAYAANTIVWQAAATGLPNSGLVRDVAFGDVNNDGKADLALATSSGVYVYAGDGAGAWSSAGMNTGLPASGQFNRVAVADITMDGKLDVVATSAGNSGILAWRGDGLGAWTAITTGLPTTGSFRGVALGDVNGDGYPDIVAGSEAGAPAGIRVYRYAAGAFAEVTGPAVTGAYYEVGIGYVDSDPYPDIVAANASGGIDFWRGSSLGTWSVNTTGLASSGGFRGVAFGDVNNDGKLDIVASRSGFAPGAGGLLVYLRQEATNNWAASPYPIAPDGSYGQVTLVDLNNDGWLDIVAGGWSPQGTTGAYTWLGGPTGFTSGPALATLGNLSNVAAADFNRDGLLDAAAGDDGGGGALAWSDGGTRQTLGSWHQVTSPLATGSPRALAITDLNRDGFLDVVAANPAAGLGAWLGNGGNGWTDCDLGLVATTGTYESAVILPYGASTGRWPTVVGGRSDNGGLRQFVNRDGACLWLETVITSTGSYYGLSVGDLEHDGVLDLVAAPSSGGLRVFRHPATGWALAGTPVATGTYVDTALGDFNHDGSLDIAAAASDGSGVSVFTSGRAWVGNVVTSTGEYHAIAAGDLNNDGNLDVVAAKNGTASEQGIFAWTGNGSGTSWTPFPSPVTTGQYFDLDLADFNHDGKLDILAARDGLGVSVWAGDGAGGWTAASTNLPATGAAFNSLFGHVDHDGNPDIVATMLGGGVNIWTAAEAAPPTFSNLTPTGWISATQSPAFTVTAQDTGSGLRIASAAYRYSTNAGANWTAYLSATLSGADGTTAAQTMLVPAVPFGQDSATANRLEVAAADVAGNQGVAQYVITVDTAAPGAPTSLTSPTHAASTWSNNPNVALTWSGASDATSGVSGYSVLLDHSIGTLPDNTVDTYITSMTTQALADGNNWYAHVRARDLAGNWSPTARNFGPVWIDTTPPSNPIAVTSTSHTVGAWSVDSTIDMFWSGGADGSGSGISGYSYVWDTSAGTLPDAAQDTTGTSSTSPLLGTGSSYYFHLRTRDVAGNWSATAVHRGPYKVDVTAPTSSLSSPATSAGSAFLVNWSGSDANSGVHGYDVQYADKTFGAMWTSWKYNTSATGDVFSGLDGHVYQFRVRARDNVGNVEAFPAGADSETGIATVDMSVKQFGTSNGLEVTQAVQDMNNSVTLIAGKRTFVRCYAQSAAGTLGSAPARLTVRRGATTMGTLTPSNPGGRITVKTSPARGARDDSFFFDVPVAWLTPGVVTFSCEVNQPRAYAETNYANNTSSTSATFVAAPAMNLVLVEVPYKYQGTVQHLRTIDRTLLESWLRRAYPISVLNVKWAYLYPPFSSVPDAEDIDINLFWKKVHAPYQFFNDKWARYYGMAYDKGGFMRGWALDIPSTVAAGPAGQPGQYHNPSGASSWDSDGTYADWYGGHELGHTYGRSHAMFCGAKGGTSYPYPDGDISPTRNSSDPAALYGFDASGPTVYGPDWKDLMTYCAKEWLSDKTYKGIYNRMVAEKPVAVAAAAQGPAATSERLVVTGRIYTPTNAITLTAFFRVPDATDVLTSTPSDYHIQFRDLGDAQLADYPFSPSFSPEDGVNEGLIAEAVTWVTGTRQIRIMQGVTSLVTRTVSTATPVVTLLFPNGGETLAGTGSVEVSWQADDVDGDTLTYALDFSRDGGTSWEPLGLGITTTVASVDLSVLPGTSQGKFRVWASDGVNTAIDASDGVFSLPFKTPEVVYIAPASGATYVVSQTVTLEGEGFDVEDNILADPQLSWTSSLQGSLGTGGMLQTTDLVTGTHVITLTVTDSQANTATSTTTVIVTGEQSPSVVYLPLVMRAF